MSKVVLLTGASAGLGLAITRKLVDRSYHVIVTARDKSISRFSEHGITQGERLWIRSLDVTSDSERRAVVSEAEDKLGGIDILINNAGVSYRSVVEHVTERDRLAQMDVNFRSPMELSRLVLPSMRQKRSGRIINISSVGGMMAMPTMAVYSASKFALEGATEALYYEVRPWNIHVTLVQPGFIHSDSFTHVVYTDLSAASDASERDPYHNHYEHMTPFIAKMMKRSRATPQTVAKKVLKVMRRRRPPLRVSGTTDALLFSLLRRLMPRRFYHWLLYRNLPHIRQWGLPSPSKPLIARPGTDKSQDSDKS